MLIVRFLLRDSTDGCLAEQVYCPSSIAFNFDSFSEEEGRTQSLPWERKTYSGEKLNEKSRKICPFTRLFAALEDKQLNTYKLKLHLAEHKRWNGEHTLPCDKKKRRKKREDLCRDGKWEQVKSRLEETDGLVMGQKDRNISGCLVLREQPPKVPNQAYLPAVIPMNEHTSTQVTNPDNTIIRKEWCCNNTLLTQHIMRWQGSRMNCWHRNSSTIMR